MFINKKSLFTLILFCMHLVVAQIQNLSIDNEYCASWKNAYVDHMSASEKQIFANILLSLLCNAIAEEKTQQFFTPIARLHQTIRTKIEQHANPADDIAMLKTLLERLSFVANTRIICLQTYNTCATHYNKNTVTLIEHAIRDIQSYAQARLRNWANEKTNQTQQALKKNSDILSETIQHFHAVSGLHRGMSEGILPMEIGPEDEENKPLIPLHIILQNNPGLQSLSDTITNTVNETTDHAAQVIHEGAEIYKQFYTILYNDLASCDQRYAATMFSMHGLLPEEYISLLPHPDRVFEHMLQTTKLYTQTEYVPS